MKVPTWLTTTPFLVFDIESTGLDFATDRVVQIAAEWCTFVDPERDIPEEASAIHGITAEEVRGAPTFAQVIPTLARMSKGRTLLGYNAAGFDAPFVRAAMARAGRPVSDRVPVDPLTWVRDLDRYVAGKGRHRLEVTCMRHGVAMDGRGAHDALADCRATWRLFRHLVETRPMEFADDLEVLLEEQGMLAAAQERNFQAWLAKQPKEVSHG
jgi:DNA polymerase-3 subunit epsilon